MSPGGHLQTIAVMSEAEFGTLGKHFRLRAGGWPQDRPSASPGLCSGQPILTETTRKRPPRTVGLGAGFRCNPGAPFTPVTAPE